MPKPLLFPLHNSLIGTFSERTLRGGVLATQVPCGGDLATTAGAPGHPASSTGLNVARERSSRPQARSARQTGPVRLVWGKWGRWRWDLMYGFPAAPDN